MKNLWKDRFNTRILVIAFIILGLSLIVTNEFGNRLVSGARAYIAGETQWTKAQKLATIDLLQYIITDDEIYYEGFESHLEVIEGDRLARLTMDENGDRETVVEGFLAGNNQPKDIPHLIWIYENFSEFKHIKHGMEVWRNAEILVDELRNLADEYHNANLNEDIDQETRELYLSWLMELDEELTRMETEFSNSMHDAALWVSNLVYWVTILVGILLTSGAGFLTIYQFREMKSWNDKLRIKDRKFSNLLENCRDVIYEMNVEKGTYEYMSPGVKKMTGYNADEIVKGGPQMMLGLTHPDDLKKMNHEFRDITHSDHTKKEIADTEFRIRKKNNEYIWVNNKRKVVKNFESGTVSIIGNVRDVTERKKYEEALDKSLKEKEMLLSEIHHRVKNNLSIVSSLIELQKLSAPEVSEDTFNEIQARIKSIAMVHEKLYKTENLADVDMADYLHDLIEMIAETYQTTSKKVKIYNKMEPMICDIKKVVPLGLICNELINNCYKHAFEGKEEGNIYVNLTKTKNQIEFTVKDDGVGLPEDFIIEEQPSLGMTLLKTLSLQIDGKLTFNSGKGTVFTVKFPD